MEGFILREATESDYARIVELSVDAISKTCHSLYSKKEIDIWIKAQTFQKFARYGNQGDFLVLEDDQSKIIAAACISTVTRYNFSSNVDHEIYTLYVSSEYTRKGVGQYLYNEIENRLVLKKATGIGVVSSSYAVPFYKKLGFTHTGTTRSLITNITCSIMERVL